MKVKRILALVLALSLCVAMAACGKKDTAGDNGGENNSTGAAENAYQVTVVDGQGKPVTDGVIVRFMKDGTQVSMQVVDANGVATKELEDGTYTVELQFTDTNAAYQYEPAQVTAENKKATITLYNVVGAEETVHAYSLVADTTVDCKAYHVAAGSTIVQLTKGERNYFLFTPTQAGQYKVSMLNNEGTVGYYGQPFFIQKTSAVDVVNGAISISVRPDNISTGETGTTVLVLGVDATSDSGVLCIERTGDYEKTTADVPYTPYQTSHTPANYTLPAGAKLTYVDIFNGKSEDYQLVMGSDGFYHLGTADGPLMLINFGKEAPNLSLEVMISGDGPMGGAPLRKYFFDDSYDPNDKTQNAVDHLIKKEDYTDIMVTYFNAADEKTRLYPLTADLEYMIKNGGEGWWTEGNPNYLFEGCNPEIGWMFACCYIN